jgi:murein DD-endopeptidase MepM/ murein hydrolase activator NlpD
MVEMRSGTITHSLFGATDAAGLPDNVATQLATIFGTWIDFHTDLRKGDRFNVVYEAIYEEGNPVRAGRILAAEFINNGERHAVVLYRGPSGKEQYYSDDGRSLQQGFLRSPLEFSRVSSNFGRRLHPIHGSWRSHNGTDFSAPVGTPIMATSDATIEFIGTQRGFGNLIVLKHRNDITTHYAHLNGFAKGLAKGQSVSQGDLIGYVGCTGWCTGPHLHYEVRIKDVPADPMTVALPMADSFNDKELAAFKRNTAHLRQRFALLNYELASALSAQRCRQQNGAPRRPVFFIAARAIRQKTTSRSRRCWSRSDCGSRTANPPGLRCSRSRRPPGTGSSSDRPAATRHSSRTWCRPRSLPRRK